MSLAMQILDAKAAGRKEWDKLKNISAWQVSEVKRELEVIDKAQTERKTVHMLERSWTYHLAQNKYSFDALQDYCFRINI